MSQRSYKLIVAGGLTQSIVNTRSARTASSAAFARRVLSGGARTATGLLPAALRWKSPDNHLLLVEQPPRVHTITYRHRMRTPTVTDRYPIALPWTLWLFVLSPTAQPVSTLLAGRPAALSSLDDPVYRLTLPNLASSGAICLPGGIVLPAGPRTPGDTIHRIMTVVWNSEFNSDIGTRPDGRLASSVPEETLDEAWGAYLDNATTDLSQALTDIEQASRVASSVSRWIEFHTTSTPPRDAHSQLTRQLFGYLE